MASLILAAWELVWVWLYLPFSCRSEHTVEQWVFGRTLEHPLIYSHAQREQISFVTAPSTKLLGCSEAICSIACSLEPVYACLSGISLLQFLRNCFDCDLVSCNASPDVSYTVIIHYCILLGIVFTGYSRFWLPLSIIPTCLC